MKLRTAVIAAAAAVVIAVAGGAGVAALTREAPTDGAGPPASTPTSTPPSTPTSTPPSTPPSSSAPSPSAPSSSAGSPTAAPSTTPPPSTSPPPATDPLSEENLLRERAYHDVTGHDFTLAARASTLLGPCTGDVTFADALPRKGVTTRSVQLDGAGGRRVVEHLAQTASAQEARTAATEIIAEVDECAAIQGGDFGYGDAVTLSSSASSRVVYFPAYDSDRDDQGGYIVIQVGARVGVVDANDAITRSQLINLAKVAAEIAAV